jgi:hypothetical protein
MTENDMEEFEERSLNEVEWYKNTHLRYKNLMLILTIGFYVIQIVDASVDAHLIDYDISEDLSFTVDPVILDRSSMAYLDLPGRSPYGGIGLRCCLKF